MLEVKKYSPSEIETLSKNYHRANFEYYRTGDSTMSDLEFDNLKEVLEFNGFNFDIEDAEPMETQHGEKLVGTSGMGSLYKVQVFTEAMNIDHMNAIANYLRQSNPNLKRDTEIMVGWKLDGNAIKILWNQNTQKIEDIITRGNFSIYKKFHDIVEKQISYHGERETRCEAVMSKITFQNKYLELGYANPRNLAAGIVNDEKLDDPRKHDITFIPLNNGISPSTTCTSQLEYRTIKLYELPRIFEEFKSIRNDYEFPTDGLVIYLTGVTDLQMKGNKYPLHSMSVKFPPVKVNALVKDIEWNLKKSGAYIPKIILEPVELDGTIQRRVAAFNYNYIVQNEIYPGAIIEIGKNGDIIAYVQRVITPGDKSKLQLPEDGKVVDIHLMANTDAAKYIADSEKFITGCYTLGIKNFGYSWFKALSEICANNILYLFNKDIINEQTLSAKIGGNKKPKEFIDKLSKLQLNTYNVIMLQQIPGCGHTTALQVAKWFDGIEHDFSGLEKSLIEDMTRGITYENIKLHIALLNETGYTIHPMKSDNHIYDATFEMTGSPKPYFDTKNQFINSVPNWKHTSLKSGTNYLITDSPESNTGKMAKARKLGIEILTYEQAYELYKSSNS